MLHSRRVYILSFCLISHVFYHFAAGLSVQSRTSSATRGIKTRAFAGNRAVETGPDPETKPDYSNIYGPLGKGMDDLFLGFFRSRLANNIGVDSSLDYKDFQGLMELAAALNARYQDRSEVQKIAKKTLQDLFPQWLPKQYAVLFSRPFPQFSARMNAWATKVGGTWLMGECEVNDIEVDGEVYRAQGLLVKRCRFLEESGCASVCVNACKIPTQDFFAQDMGLPLTMTPNYETHECQFSFGVAPTEEDELAAKSTPCLSRCPTNGSLKAWHDEGRNSSSSSQSSCQYMETSLASEEQ